MATAMNATSTFSCPRNGTAHDGTLLCHWTNSPSGRGTLNIFWLCISTLGLCVWNAVHPNILRPKTPGWLVFWKRVCWLFVGLFMPEMLVLVALGQFRLAWELLARIDGENIAPTQFPWWMFLVESWRPKNGNLDSSAERWMKALLRWMEPLLRCLRVPSRLHSDAEKGHSLLTGENDPSPPAAAGADDAPAHDSSKASDTSRQPHNTPRPAVSVPAASNCAREHPWTLTHSFYAVMNGFVDEEGGTITLFHTSDMKSKGLLDRLMLPLGDPDRIPDVSVDDIEDRGKAGVLAKSLLVWQLFVFLANCVARWDQSLPLSLLEITTIGHSLCSIIAMVLWWYKPHSVGEATVIGRKSPLPWLSSVWSWLFPAEFLLFLMAEVAGKVPSAEAFMNAAGVLTTTAIAVLYGLPHLLGLSIHFPTVAEQHCWTVATSVVIGSPVVMCAAFWIEGIVYSTACGRLEHAVDRLLIWLLLVLVVLYPIASMFLVGESVRQIFALPVESFREPQLTYYLPSFS